MSPQRNPPMPGHANDLGFDPTDPVQVAVKVTRLESALVSAQQAFTGTASNLDRGIQTLSSEVSKVHEQLRELTRLGHTQEDHGKGLGRAFKAIEDLAHETNRRFSEQDEDLTTWRTRYEEERDRWRHAHENDNRKTREKLILWNGVGLGVSLLAATLVAVLVYVYVGDKAAAQAAIVRIENDTKDAQRRIELRLEQTTGANAEAIRRLERDLPRREREPR